MATRNNEMRSIDVNIVSANKKELFFIVTDNGRGMDCKGLENLAIFAHAPIFRKSSEKILDTSSTKKMRYMNSCISKFGVGLKNAAFHIGSNMVVITKTEKSEKVLEFKMNINVMRDTYKIQKDSTYMGKIFSRNPGDFKNSLVEVPKGSTYVKKTIEDEIGKKSFTTIVISELKDTHIKNLAKKENRDIFCKNLASLYHFYLNGVYGKNSTERMQALSAIFLNLANISVSYAEEAKKQRNTIHLHEIDDDIHSLNHLMKKGDPFMFEIFVPHRDPVVGCIFYYPFLNDEETIPPFYRSNMKYNELKNEVDTLRNFKKSKDSSFDPIFYCFWQGRQIPFTEVSILNFMNSVEPYLRKRMRGFLFLNETFKVNPQKNIFNESLDEILNLENAKINVVKDENSDYLSGKRLRTSHERKMQSPNILFKNWAAKTSQNYDKEIQYKSPIDSKSIGFDIVYGEAIYGNKVFKIDDLIKLESKGTFHYGKVVKFIANKKSVGVVIYHRLPYRIYREKQFSLPTRSIVKDIDKESIKEEYRIHRKELLAKYPDYLSFDFDTKLYTKIDPVLRESVQSGYRFPDCYIKILGKTEVREGDNSLISVKINDYKKNVTLVVRQILKKYKHSEEDWVVDEIIDGTGAFECPPLSKKYFKKGAYYFKPVVMKLPGKYQMEFFVTLKGKTTLEDVILTKKFEFEVEVGLPYSVRLEKRIVKVTAGAVNEHKNEFIGLEIKDEGGNLIEGKTNMGITAEFPDSDHKVESKVVYMSHIQKHVITDIRVSPVKPTRIEPNGKKIKTKVVFYVDEKKISEGKVDLHLLPGIPEKIINKNKNIRVENGEKIKNAAFCLLDKYGNKTKSKYGIDNLTFEVLKGEDLESDSFSLIGRSANNEFCLSNFRIKLNPKIFQNKNLEKVSVNYKVFANSEKGLNEHISTYSSSLKVHPSKQISKFVIFTDFGNKFLEDGCVAELNFMVGIASRVYVRFFNEANQEVEGISLDDFKYFSAKVFGENVIKLQYDDDDKFFIEIKAPERISGIRNCYAECMTIWSKKKITREFKIFPVYDEPVKWDLDFVDTLKSGTRISDCLSIYFLDKYGNRLGIDEFEDPLTSNPIVKSTCNFENMNPDLDSNKKCIYFPDGVVSGPVGIHTVEIEENPLYQFKQSNVFKFTLEHGYPKRLNNIILSENGNKDKNSIWSTDLLRIELWLLDGFGNTVTSGNYPIEVTLLDKKNALTKKTFTLREGKLEETFLAKLDSSYVGKEVELRFRVVDDEFKIDATKTLSVHPTPNLINSLVSDSALENYKMEYSSELPVLKWKILLDDENGIYSGSPSCFRLQTSLDGNDQLYGPSEIHEGKWVIFSPIKTAESSGILSFRTLFEDKFGGSTVKIKSDDINVTVLSGSPVALQVDNKKDYEMLSASNNTKSNKIVDFVSLSFVDKHGNAILNQDKSQNPMIGLKLISDVIPSKKWPKITWKRKSKNEFYGISVVEGSGSGEGKCRLEFSVNRDLLEENGNSAFSKIPPTFIDFRFSNDCRQVKMAQKIDSKTMNRKIAIINENIKAITEKIDKSEKVKENMSDIRRRHPEYCSLSLQNALAKKNSEAEVMRREANRKKLFHSLAPFNDPITDQKGYIGRIGELIVVENIGVARCVQYLLGSKLNLHLTRGAESPATKASLLYLKEKQGFSCLDILLLPKKTFDKGLKNEGKLPHESFFTFDRNALPSYIVKKLQLRSGYNLSKIEFESIFVYLLGNAMLMRSIDEAIEYEKQCVRRKIYCSPIMTIDGFKVQLIKHKIPSFESMKNKQRSISVYPKELFKRITYLESNVWERVSEYFEMERIVKNLEKTNVENEKKRAAFENELIILTGKLNAAMMEFEKGFTRE